MRRKTTKIMAWLCLGLGFSVPYGHTMSPKPAASVQAAPELKPILANAKSLKANWQSFAAHAHSSRSWPDQKGWDEIKNKIETLAALDLQGHLALKAKGTDQDLKCILKGLHLDGAKRIQALKTAHEPTDKAKAADDLVFWVEDHIDILSAAKTAESGLDCVIEFGADGP